MIFDEDMRTTRTIYIEACDRRYDFFICPSMRHLPSAQHAEYDGGKADRRRRRAQGQRSFSGPPQDIPDLVIGDPLGRGNFSRVYRGIYRGAAVAVKAVESGTDEIIDTEIEILRELRGCANVVQLIDVIFEPRYVLVFELAPNIEKEILFSSMTIDSVRTILHSTLAAIAAAHSRGIVHRDIKLTNILIDPEFRSAVVGDWGCGAWVSASLKAKAGSRSCRPPEMLFGFRGYGTRCDIWAFGILVLNFLSGNWIPWRRSGAVETLAAMSPYFGGNNLKQIAVRLGLPIPETLVAQREWNEEVRKPIEILFYDPVTHLRDPALIEIMKSCLQLDLEARPHADELLQHPFFARQSGD
jgi:serine/threonine protein kinase